MGILAIDVGVHMGLAWEIIPGRPLPNWRGVDLKKPSQGREVAYSSLVAHMQTGFDGNPPTMIVKEAPFRLQAFKNKANSEDSILCTLGLHAIIEMMAHRYGIPCHDIAVSTVRKHFLGKASLGSRPETKLAVLNRCKLLGYLPENVKDDNVADALAVLDWAISTLGRKPPAALHMFGESA